MEQLDSALASALEGRGQIVGVVGEAGVGKSRLCREFVERCRARCTPVWEAHCLPYGRSLPLLPLVELMRNFFGVGEHDDPSEARRRIAGTLVLLDDSLREDLPLAFDFARVPDPQRPVPEMDPEVRQRGWDACEPFALRLRARLLGDAAAAEDDRREAKRLFEQMGAPLRAAECERELAG